MAPPEGFKPPSYEVEARCLILLDHGGKMVRAERFELSRLTASGLKPGASTCFATLA